jgi:hypothetical protein
MGYWSNLHLVDIRIPKPSRASVKREIRHHASITDDRLRLFLKWVEIDSEGFLCFRDDPEDYCGYSPDEDGCVPAKPAKWGAAEAVVQWLSTRTDGGKIVFHSFEGDGRAWGYEFDGRGKARRLDLVPVEPTDLKLTH